MSLPLTRAGWRLSTRGGLALSVAFAALTATSVAVAQDSSAPTRQSQEQGSREGRTLSYPIEGEHAAQGPFTGTLTATFRDGQAHVTQTMDFADGSSETIEVRGPVKDNRVTGSVRRGIRFANGAIQALEGAPSSQSQADMSRVLHVSFDGPSVSTRLVDRSPLQQDGATATASGELAPAAIDQGLEGEDAETWHNRTQGLSFLPAGWFLALEQAGSDGMFSDPDHMRRFGFLPGGAEGLPVGFAIQGDEIGFSCAACHTAEIEAFGEPLRIEGGRGNVDLGMFRGALGQALAVTAQTPDKFQRFAARVLARDGQAVDAAGMQAVGAAVKAYLLGAKARAEQTAALGLAGTSSGPGRVDAYNNGANAILGPLNPKNLAPPEAPVRLPHLWGTADFAWVQYNGGIRLPLARNLIASIAAGAKLALVGEDGKLLPEAERYESSARVEDLEALESSMEQIGAPAWPGYVDPAAAARGRKLYQENCTKCHDRGKWSVGSRWGERFLELPMFPLKVIGTDPGEALSFQRTVDASALGLGSSVPVPEALKFVSDQILAKQGSQPSRPNDLRAPAAYRARSLEGIWAAAPYLHNGSVLTIYELLSPASERRASFLLSTQPKLDAKQLGLVEPAQGFEFDTTQPGNSNSGHEFRDAPMGTQGVIGRELSEDERYDLIEFLKTL